MLDIGDVIYLNKNKKIVVIDKEENLVTIRTESKETIKNLKISDIYNIVIEDNIENTKFGEKIILNQKEYTIYNVYCDRKYLDLISKDGEKIIHFPINKINKNILDLEKYKNEEYILYKKKNFSIFEERIMKDGGFAYIDKINKDKTVNIKLESFKVNGRYVSDTRKRQNIEDFIKGKIKNPYITNINSKMEKIFNFYLGKYGYKKVKINKLFPDKVKNKFFEFDLYNEKTKIAIEIDDSLHETESGRKMDINKNVFCKDNGIKLIRVRSSECKIDEDATCFMYTKYKVKRNKFEEINYILNQIIKEIGEKEKVNIEKAFNKILRSFLKE